jgi:hypothetical protein
MFERTSISLNPGRRSLFSGVFRSGWVLALGLVCSQVATATQQGAVGTIASFRIYTVSSVPSTAHDVSAFQLSPAMGSGCVWAWVDATDKSALAVVLAAKTTGASVTINFDDAVFSPWGDTSMCVLQLISLN